MKSLASAMVQAHGGLPASRRPLVRLLGIAPAALLLSGLVIVSAGPLAGPVAASGAAVSFTITGLASSAPGVTQTITVTAKDASADTATTYRGRVLFTSSDPLATLPANYTFTAADQGAHWFSVTLRTPGTPSVTVTDTVTASITGSENGLVVFEPGTVVAWGDDSSGQTNVPAGLSGVVAISAGYAHSLALKSDGTVVAWGWDSQGATDVPDGMSGVSAVSAG